MPTTNSNNHTEEGLILTAGTTGVAPVNFTSGTNRTTPGAGTMEYDGKVIYISSLASERNVNIGKQYLIQGADRTGSNVNTAQNIFDTVTNGRITVTSATTYMFELWFYTVRSAGSNAHTTGISFGGTATFTSLTAECLWSGVLNAQTSTTITRTILLSAANTQIGPSSTITTENGWCKVTGIMRVNAGGTIIPQFTYSAAPGGAPTIKANSYMWLETLGTNTNNSVGNWD